MIGTRLRKARRFVAQLLNIPHRTPDEEAELAWWERRVLFIEQELKEAVRQGRQVGKI